MSLIDGCPDCKEYWAELKETRKALRSALEWIDAVPKNVDLPVMPGFDRDWADSLVDGTWEGEENAEA